MHANPSAIGSAQPIAPAEFARLMTAVGPFETAPALAVGVSGGADSLALCLLAAAWTLAAGGRLTALVVDHGLRPAAADDARRVRTWLEDKGIACVVLPWLGPKPATGIEAAAREARYRLLLGWCREQGVLHLLIAHHARDQAETVLIRLSRGSGFEGLAAMREIWEGLAVRILRPMLTVEPERLKATLAAHGQEWIEDPMNADPAFARSRWRAAAPRLEAAGISSAMLTEMAGHAQAARSALDDAVAAMLVRGCLLDDAGFARLGVASLREAPAEIAWRALARVAAAVGGRRRLPARAAAVRLLGQIAERARVGIGTLARSRLFAEGEEIVVCRELRGLPPPTVVVPGQRRYWDGRFIVEIGADVAAIRRGRLWLQALPAPAWRSLRAACERCGDAPWLPGAWPAEASLTLPALVDEAGVLAVPHLRHLRGESSTRGCAGIVTAIFAPRCPMTGMGYFLDATV